MDPTTRVATFALQRRPPHTNALLRALCKVETRLGDFRAAQLAAYLVHVQAVYGEVNLKVLHDALAWTKRTAGVHREFVSMLPWLLCSVGGSALTVLSRSAFRTEAFDAAARHYTSMYGLPREKDDRDTAVQLAVRLPIDAMQSPNMSTKLREYRRAVKASQSTATQPAPPQAREPTPRHWRVQLRVVDAAHGPSLTRMNWVCARLGQTDDHCIPGPDVMLLVIANGRVEVSPGTHVWNVFDTNRFVAGESSLQGFSPWLVDVLVMHGHSPTDLTDALHADIYR